MAAAWHDKVTDALERSIEAFSPGGLSYRATDDGGALAAAPALLETMEGEEIYPHFHLDVSSFIELFDEPPEIGLRTFPETQLSFGGSIDGEEAFVEVFAQPFADARPTAVVDAKGDLSELPACTGATNELEDAVVELVQAFRDRFGRDPAPGDPLFFDPDADEPTPLDPEQVAAELAASAERAGLRPAHIHAMQRTGLIVTEENRHLFSATQLEEWRAAVAEGDELYGTEH